MTKNESNTDRIVRVVAGVLTLAAVPGVRHQHLHAPHPHPHLLDRRRTAMSVGVDGTAIRERLPAEVAGLLRYARTLVRDQAAAEDLVQETVVRALEKAGDYRGDASLATWTHRILHNLAVDRVRRSRETPVADPVEIVEASWQDDTYTVDAAGVVARAETRTELEDALVHLPIIYRAAVVLHDAEGLTVCEVADVQQVSLAAAKQRLRRGRMMLVTELARGSDRRRALEGVPMRCWDARSRVSDFMDGDLTPVEAAQVQRHLEGCPTCPPLYAALVATREALGVGASPPAAGRDPDTVLPPALARRVFELLHGQDPGETNRPTRPSTAEKEFTMDARLWDERYASTDLVWSTGPNGWVEQVTTGLAPGTALDLGAGEGRNALWLAEHGWRVTAVDFSQVALDRARQLADERLGPESALLTTVTADLTAYQAVSSYDLVLVVYIHLPAAARRRMLSAAARAVAPGGLLVVVAHHPDNLDGGVGGPQDPALLYTAEDVVDDVSSGQLAPVRAERVLREVETATGTGQAIDTLAVLKRELGTPPA